MIRVRMKVSIASNDWSYVPDQETELDDDLAQVWAAGGHCEIIGPSDGKDEIPEDKSLDSQLTPLGGSWYALPNGVRIQGIAKALEALKAAISTTVPEGGDDNGAEDDNSTDSGTS